MLTKKTKKIVAIASAGFVAGVVVTTFYTQKTAFILKEAQWNDHCDMVLTFFGRDQHMIIPNPKS